MEIGSETIAGERITIEVDGSGTFSAEFGDVEYRAESRKALVEQLKKAAKHAAKLTPAEATLLNWDPAVDQWGARRQERMEGKYTHVVLRGRHPRTRALLLTLPNGKKESMNSYDGTDEVARRLTDAEVMEFQRLKAAIQEAEAAYDAWYQSVKFDVDRWLKKGEED